MHCALIMNLASGNKAKYYQIKYKRLISSTIKYKRFSSLTKQPIF